MIAVADSSPLIILAKLNCFASLQKLYSRFYISQDVRHEVVIVGAGMPGASEVNDSTWIEVKTLQDRSNLLAAHKKSALGLGELSTILLAKEVRADEVLLDDFSAREYAKQEGLHVRGSVGLLEIFYRKGYLADLRAAFRQLLTHNVYIDRRLLDRRLKVFNLPPL